VGALAVRFCDREDADKEFLTEAHKSLFTIHPGEVCTEFFVNWWNDMKKDVADYVSKYLVCQQVKVEHQRPGGMLQNIQLLEWKWEHFTMDVVSATN
jgi:hypothetical protein